MVKLICAMVGSAGRAFPVEIDASELVGDVKEAIKDKNKNDLEKSDADKMKCSRLPPSANEVGISKLPFNNNFNSNYQYGHRGSHEKQHKPAAHFRICKTNAKYQPTIALPRTDSMPAQLILLFPEDVPQDTRTSLAAPTYAEICDDSEPERVRHVINYGYYRDGGKAPPASIRLGEIFCADPASSPTEGDERQEITSRTRTNSGTIDQVPLANLLDTLDQAADLSIPGTDRHEHEEGVDYGNATENDSLRQVSPDVTPRDCGAASAPVRIMSVLANYPDLLEAYASQLQQLGPERKRPRVQAISDSVLTTPRYEDGGDRRHNFRPSQGQQAMHDAISAVEHREEFFDAPTRRLITTAKAFSEELNDYAPWSPEEVKAVAFWFSNVLEAHRRATEFDISHGTSTRSELPRRFCMQDSELSGMLLKLSRGRDEVARHGKRKLHEPQLETSDRPPYRSNRGNNRQVTSRQVPIAVNQAAPRLNGKQLCLRYISAKGCPSKVSDRCTYDFLGHFTPDTLAPVVQEYVVEKYGGLSSEMSSRV
ncbi:hypothetical protein PInf_011608 [Phytophthora infestans]|nr:hypothetical protein PInf_011608 [Phytophthora infestans]